MKPTALAAVCLATLTPTGAQVAGSPGVGAGPTIILDSAARSDRLLWLSLLQDRDGTWGERGGPLVNGDSSLRELDVALSWAARQRALQSPPLPRIPDVSRQLLEPRDALVLSPTFFEEIGHSQQVDASHARPAGDDHEGLMLLNLRLAQVERDTVAALRSGGSPSDALREERRRLIQRRDEIARKLRTPKTGLSPETLVLERQTLRQEEQKLLQKKLSKNDLDAAQRAQAEEMLRLSESER